VSPSAWEVYEGARAAFTPPPGWAPEGWRRDLVLASGRTALAVEALLRDLGTAGPGAVCDPGRLPALLDGDGFTGRPHPAPGLLGCSFSCGSAEVLDGLAAAGRRGLPTCLIGAGGRGTPDVAVPAAGAPPWLQHVLFAAVLPALLGAPGRGVRDIRCAPGAGPDGAAAFLGEVFAAGLIPVFVAAGDGFRVRALLSYWLEYLHRPGFFVRFPAWTHDLLWALVHAGERRFAFVLEPPAEDLSDRRFERVLDWLTGAGIPFHRLAPFSATPVAPAAPAALAANGAHVGWLLDGADAVAGLAAAVGADLTAHLGLDARGRILQQ
jgi:hypothetical protein